MHSVLAASFAIYKVRTAVLNNKLDIHSSIREKEKEMNFKIKKRGH